MKVALVSSFFSQDRGGAATSVGLLARRLVSEGIEVVVIATHAHRHIKVEQAGAVKVYWIAPWNLYWIGNKDSQPVWKKVFWQLLDVWNPHALWLVRRILERELPDIVHANKIRGFSPAVWSAARSTGRVPVVQSCRDYELMSPEGTLAGRVGYWAQEGAWPLRPYQRIRARMSEAVAVATAPSRYTLQMHIAHGFFRSASTRVVPNSHGWSLSQLQRLEKTMRPHLASTDGQVRLLYLGRLEKIKGVDLLCSAFERCAADHPSLTLHIAGWGTMATALQQRYGTHPQITLHGPVFGAAKARLLAECTAVVLPSVCPEVFGNVIAEAYAFGKPVIASRAGGIPEIVDHERTGVLVPTDDVTALRQVISSAAREPAALRRMASACFDAARLYEPRAMARTYASIYEELLERGR